jgi:phage virion morphogenesis protein
VSQDLHELEAWAAALIERLTPAARRRLARDITTKLRASQQQRIAAQLNPDGTPYAPRKPQLRKKAGRIRRTMFAKLSTARFMKTEASPDAAFVGLIGRVERIARVHQLGLRDRVQSRGPEYNYPARKLLGITGEDRSRIGKDLLTSLV